MCLFVAALQTRVAAVVFVNKGVLRPVSVVCWCCFFAIVKLGVVLLRFGCHLSSYAYWTLHLMHANTYEHTNSSKHV
jgi:hypothetical protein